MNKIYMSKLIPHPLILNNVSFKQILNKHLSTEQSHLL